MADNIVTLQDMKNVLGGRQLTLKTLLAYEALTTGVVPASAIMKRLDGVPYISHIWMNETLNEAFRYLWDFEKLNHEIDPYDGSASVTGKLTIHFPQKDGSYYVRTVTEVGSFDAFHKSDKNGVLLYHDSNKEHPVYTMSTADRIASATSRCLARCVARMFDIGHDLGDKYVKLEMTDLMAWNSLVRYGSRNGLSKEQVRQALLDAGIKSDELVVNYEKAWKVVTSVIRGDDKELPNDEDRESS